MADVSENKTSQAFIDRNNYNVLPFLCFRDKETFSIFSNDLNTLINWLLSRYPDDNEMKHHIEQLLSKYQHLPANVFMKELHRTTSKTTRNDEVKKILRESFSQDRRITGECEIDISSEDACLTTFKRLDALIKSDKRNILLNSSLQGRVLKHLKTSLKKSGSFIKALQDKQISISLSHCNFLIAFHDLVNKYPNIIQCSLELRFFIKNLKIVKEVAAEVFDS